MAAEVFEPIAWRMARDGFPYRGVLYAGLMLTADGPMVLEFNARFGDPEAQVLLPMLDGDLAGALLGCATGDRSLMEGSVAMRAGAAVGVVVASEGYPDAPIAGRVVEGAEPASAADDGELLCFHAGTARRPDGRYETTGGRVLAMVGRGATMQAARDAAYRGVASVELDGGRFRTDIAARELVPAIGLSSATRPGERGTCFARSTPRRARALSTYRPPSASFASRNGPSVTIGRRRRSERRSPGLQRLADTIAPRSRASRRTGVVHHARDRRPRAASGRIAVQQE